MARVSSPFSGIAQKTIFARYTAEATCRHFLIVCPVHRASHGARSLTVLDNETLCWLNIITASHLIRRVQQPGVV